MSQKSCKSCGDSFYPPFYPPLVIISANNKLEHICVECEHWARSVAESRGGRLRYAGGVMYFADFDHRGEMRV